MNNGQNNLTGYKKLPDRSNLSSKLILAEKTTTTQYKEGGNMIKNTLKIFKTTDKFKDIGEDINYAHLLAFLLC